MKFIYFFLFIMPTNLLKAMDYSAWIGYVANWNNKTYMSFNEQQKQSAKREITMAKQAIVYCTTMGNNNQNAINEAKNGISKKALLIKDLVSPVLDDLNQMKSQEARKKIDYALILITQREAKL